MKKLWYVVLSISLILSACSAEVHSNTVKAPIISITLFTLTPAPTLTTVSTKTMTPSNTPQPTETLVPTRTPTPTETEQPKTPKILLLGDSLISITRVPKYFSELFIEAGITVEFVGDEVSYGNDVPADGLGGFNTVRMLKQLTSETVWTKLNGSQFPNNFESHIPDIVVIQLGTNDAVNASEGGWDPAPIYRENMQKIIEFLRSRNPNVIIIVPMLIPSEWPEYTAKINLINSTIPDFVEMMDSPNSRVVTTVNLKDAWKNSDFADNVHPDNSGSQKIAQAYFDALVNNDLLGGY